MFIVVKSMIIFLFWNYCLNIRKILILFYIWKFYWYELCCCYIYDKNKFFMSIKYMYIYIYLVLILISKNCKLVYWINVDIIDKFVLLVLYEVVWWDNIWLYY